MSRTLTRGFMLAGVVVAGTIAGAMTEAKAQYRPAPKYCARTYDGQMECAFFTLQQCQAAMSATGGDCAINPRFAGYPPSGPYQPQPRRYYR